MPLIEITEENYDKIAANGERAVLIEFGAEYCAPCHALAPIMESLSREYGNIEICSADVEKSPKLAARFRVMNIPTVIAVRSGEVIGRVSGKISKDDIIRLIGATEETTPKR
jgi:thioredoxin 1